MVVNVITIVTNLIKFILPKIHKNNQELSEVTIRHRHHHYSDLPLRRSGPFWAALRFYIQGLGRTDGRPRLGFRV